MGALRRRGSGQKSNLTPFSLLVGPVVGKDRYSRKSDQKEHASQRCYKKPFKAGGVWLQAECEFSAVFNGNNKNTKGKAGNTAAPSPFCNLS
jgi:hypothetical protein